jgi:hypothetical protein
MRLWSIDPRYLDRKGLLAVWREALLAQKVLRGATRGYTKHPQLERFKQSTKPLDTIGVYLYYIYLEGARRKYRFDKEKIISNRRKVPLIKVPSGQLDYEVSHLSSKLKRRDKNSYNKILKTKTIKLHPLFKKVKGGIETWERV